MFAPHFDPVHAWSSVLIAKESPTDLDAQLAPLGFAWKSGDPFSRLTQDEVQHTFGYENATNGNVSRFTHTLESKTPCSALIAETLTIPASWLKPGSYLSSTATGYFSTEEDPPLRRKWPKGDLGSDDPRAYVEGPFKRNFLTDFEMGKATWICPGKPFGLQLSWDVALLPYLWFEKSGSGENAVVRLRAASGLTTALSEGHGLIEIPASKPLTLSLQLMALPV